MRGAIHGRGLSREFILRDQRARSLKEVMITRQRPQRRQLWALRDVDIDVLPGESFGIVGANGSGKSTLLKLIAGIYPPSEGELRIGGRVGSLLEVGAGFHPDFTGTENVYLSAAVFGIRRTYVDEHLAEILAFAELEEFADQPVKTYSSGMYVRLGFSIAMHIQPDVLLLDEVLAVGDEAFQQKCHGRIWEFKRSGGTIVYVSHDPISVERLCERAMLLERGRVIESGTPEDVLRTYHRRLASRPAAPVAAPAAAGEDTGPVQILDLRAIAGDGAIRTRFLEAEPVVLETTLLVGDGRRGRAVHAVGPGCRRAARRLAHQPVGLAAAGDPGGDPVPRRGAAVPRGRLPDRRRGDEPRQRRGARSRRSACWSCRSSRTTPAGPARCGWRARGSCPSRRRRWNASQHLEPRPADGVPAARGRHEAPSLRAQRGGQRRVVEQQRERRVELVRIGVPEAPAGPPRLPDEHVADGVRERRAGVRPGLERDDREALVRRRRAAPPSAPASASCFVCSST